MPVVKTKQNIDRLADGDVLEVLATDPGSVSDLGGWADTTDGVELLDQQEDDVNDEHGHARHDGRRERGTLVCRTRRRVEELEERVADAEAADEDGRPKMSIIATKGTLDMAYPPPILASTAAAFDYEVTVFHTFWGLDILHEEHSKNLKLRSVGNPNMPVPNIVSSFPGTDRVTTSMMEKRIEDNDAATVEELIETSLDMGVEFQACQMTIDLMGYDEDDFYDGVTTGVGAATAIRDMADAREANATPTPEDLRNYAEHVREEAEAAT